MNSSSRRIWLKLAAAWLLLALLAGCAQSPAETSEQSGAPPVGESVPPVGESVPPTGESAATAGETASFTITITEDGMNPSTIRLHQGDKVRLTFVTEDPYGGDHPMYLDGYGLDVSLKPETPEQTMEFTADQAGTFGIFCLNQWCAIHQVLQSGQLVVE